MLARAVLVVLCLALNSVAAPAQLYDPEKGSPMSLLVAPKEGIAYYELRKQAAQLLTANAAEAEPLIEPVHGNDLSEEPQPVEGLVRREAAGWQRCCGALKMSPHAAP